jgi:hypothetical protein
MKRIIFIALLFASANAFTQEILLEQNVKSDSIRPSRGPNLKNFSHFYIGLGFPINTNEDVTYTKFGSSTNIDFGFRYKRKFTNFFATGFDLGIGSTTYNLSQDVPKTVPDTIINEKEKFRIFSVSPSAYLRFNFGRRGNYVGNFLDLGAYGDWNIRKLHLTVNENEQDEKVKVETTRLDYMENFSYGFLARAGSNRYVVTAKYRMSDIFKSSYAIPELPRLTVGVEVGLF